MSARTHLPSGLVTFLFTDIEGSTRLAQMLGSGYRPVLQEHRQVIRRALSKADGVELFTEGDSLFVAFADATAALAACIEAQRELAAHDWPAAADHSARALALAPKIVPLKGERALVDFWQSGNLAPLQRFFTDFTAYGRQVAPLRATPPVASAPARFF